MRYVKQLISDFTASNATESVLEWSAATTYAVGDFARVGTYIYQSVIASNLDFSPIEYLDIKWFKHSTSNRFAMLDLSASSSTVYAGALQVEFLQSGMDTLGIGNYTSDTITVEVLDTNGTTVLWTYETDELLNECVEDYYTYMYCDYNIESDRALYVPLGYDGYKVRVTFNQPANVDTKCGFLVAGIGQDMGETLSDVKFRFNSYAIKSFDDFGDLSITKRAVQDIVDFETIIDKEAFISNKRKIKAIYNDIIMFVVDDDTESIYESLITLGVVQDVAPIISSGTKHTISWSVIEAI